MNSNRWIYLNFLIPWFLNIPKKSGINTVYWLKPMKERFTKIWIFIYTTRETKQHAVIFRLPVSESVSSFYLSLESDNQFWYKKIHSNENQITSSAIAFTILTIRSFKTVRWIYLIFHKCLNQSSIESLSTLKSIKSL